MDSDKIVYFYSPRTWLDIYRKADGKWWYNFKPKILFEKLDKENYKVLGKRFQYNQDQINFINFCVGAIYKENLIKCKESYGN